MSDKSAGIGETDLFGSSEVRDVPRATPREKSEHEPQMRALRRILGDSVLDIFPEGLMDSMAKAYVHWQEHPDSYLVTAFPTKEERDDTLTVMRAFSECAGDEGYTVRTESGHPDNVLSWRVQTRRGKTQKDASA